jgi:hypothetical protein
MLAAAVSACDRNTPVAAAQCLAVANLSRVLLLLIAWSRRGDPPHPGAATQCLAIVGLSRGVVSHVACGNLPWKGRSIVGAEVDNLLVSTGADC